MAMIAYGALSLFVSFILTLFISFAGEYSATQIICFFWAACGLSYMLIAFLSKDVQYESP
ncbi:hypothetical protein C0584_04595 [Candidatus Parcubacteria bacterium]|nr:MAG: hypothetical protein C0584_04595 [Candidatus Parcubacteria bacterium]